MKTCIKCNERKDKEEFHYNSKTRDNLTSSCKDCVKIYRKQNKDLIHGQTLKRKYGITHQDYLRMLDEQEGVCATCGLEESKNLHGRLYVDHNHETGKVRGLLCHQCNKALGNAQDDATILYNLYKYKLHHDEGDTG